MTDQPKTTAPAGRKKWPVSDRERICLAELASVYCSEGNCLPFLHIAATTQMTVTDVRRSVRALARKGFTELIRGLFNDEGDFCGSAYCATRAGFDLIREWEKANPPDLSWMAVDQTS